MATRRRYDHVQSVYVISRAFVRAPVRDFQGIFQALLLFLRGAVRYPSPPALLKVDRRGDSTVAAKT